VARARALGLGLYLDGVFNHVGERHPWARDPRYVSGSVWRGHGHLPELRLESPRVREALFGARGVVARWTERGASGWRLDCANDLGREICGLAARAAADAGAQDGTIGELMSYPAGATGQGALDGVMNYWLRSVALALASGRAPEAALQAALDRLAAEMAPEGLARSWNVLSTHDTPRLATALEGAAARVRAALVLQVAYPGVPLVYYGEEVGMAGGADPANRAPMIWDEARWDQTRLALVRQLLRLRREEPALAHGGYLALPQPGTGVVAFARTTARPDETIVYVGNARAEPTRARLFLPLAPLFDALPLHDLLSPFSARMEGGCLDVRLPAHGALLLRSRDDHPSGYRFFKAR
jgi:alpha-glucosidase